MPCVVLLTKPAIFAGPAAPQSRGMIFLPLLLLLAGL
jgi:hypothetical protein